MTNPEKYLIIVGHHIHVRTQFVSFLCLKVSETGRIYKLLVTVPNLACPDLS
jgi:hypothetical protein